RSRSALRHKRAKDGNPDPKATIRNNLRYSGVPLEIKYRDRHLKPRLVLICDISTSMRYCAEFMLTLLYECQDQVSKTRSFIFNDPRLDLAYDLRRRSRRLLWFNPEPSAQWGTGDSDMHNYAPVSSVVFQVRNLAQLVDAIDRIMADG